MPIPLLIIPFVVMGAAGLGIGAKGGADHIHAKKLNDTSENRINIAAERLEDLRKKCGDALQNLGEEKIYVLNNNIKTFVDEFSKLKNVDFRDSLGLMELKNLHLDQKEFEDLKKLTNIAAGLIGGAAAGTAGGALVAFGAYSAAMTFASASTGTAIASLSGAAATNATLAFFGGGSLAAGGAGMAGGAAVLGGIVAGPALLAMGIIIGRQGKKSLERAKINAANANEICAEFELGATQCIAIRRRTYMFYNLLAQIDSYMLPLVFKMKDIIANEGVDYSMFSEDSKKVIASAAACAVTAKSILDTPILTREGNLTSESETLIYSVSNSVKQLEETK